MNNHHIVAVCKGTIQQHPTPVACNGIVIETEDDELLWAAGNL